MVCSLPDTDLQNYDKELTPTLPHDISDWSLTAPVKKLLSPIYAQLHVGSIIMILPDFAMDFKYLNK